MMITEWTGWGLLFLAQAAVTWFLVGLIWVIQVVHYPLMAQVSAASFGLYESLHQQRITWVVGPTMLLELVLAVGLTVVRPAYVSAWAVWASAGLVGVVWLSTAFVQVPLHTRLVLGFDSEVIAQLVATNWLRTIAWTLKGLLALYLLQAWAVAGKA